MFAVMTFAILFLPFLFLNQETEVLLFHSWTTSGLFPPFVLLWLTANIFDYVLFHPGGACFPVGFGELLSLGPCSSWVAVLGGWFQTVPALLFRGSCRWRICPGHPHGRGKSSVEHMSCVTVFPSWNLFSGPHKPRPRVLYPQSQNPKGSENQKHLHDLLWHNLTFTVLSYLCLCHLV